MTGALTATAALSLPSFVTVDRLRVKRQVKNAIIVIIVMFGALLLVREAGNVALAVASIAHANPIGLVVTALLGAITYLAAAVAITAASGRNLPLTRTTAVQLGAACTNRIAPAGLGGMATNLRYLERDGATRSQAATAIGITSVASFVVHAIATITALALVNRPVAALGLSIPSGITLPMALAGAIATVALSIALAQRFGPRIMASLREAWAALALLCCDPRRLVRLAVGTIGVTLGHGFAFAAAVTACGVHLPVLELLAVFLAGSAVGSAAPTPGGLGALEAALVAGLTTLGAAAAPAVAGVLTYRLITYWLPIIPGAVALKLLRRDTLSLA